MRRVRVVERMLRRQIRRSNRRRLKRHAPRSFDKFLDEERYCYVGWFEGDVEAVGACAQACAWSSPPCIPFVIFGGGGGGVGVAVAV